MQMTILRFRANFHDLQQIFGMEYINMLAEQRNLPIY